MNSISNHILLSKATNLILRFWRRYCKDTIIVSLLEALSEVIHPIYWLIWIYCIWRKIILLTFDVIWMWSVTNKKQWARWSPECHPGILWNPIKSALRWSFLTTPVGVVCSIAWIQWAVTAMKDTPIGAEVVEPRDLTKEFNILIQ